MADFEVRDALSRRLQKNLSDPSSPGNPVSSPVRSGRMPPLPASKLQNFSPSTATSAPPGDVRVEGFLYKYSSGHLSRWQKRFFILDAGRLSYYKKLPNDRDPASLRANKAFSVRRIKTVQIRETSEGREFELVFTTGRSYQLRAPSADDVDKWTSSLKAAMSFCEANPDASPLGADEGMSDFGSVGSHTISESSPRSPAMHSSDKLTFLQGLVPRRESFANALHFVRPEVAQTVWEVEVDGECLDKNFEEWFYFVPQEGSVGPSSSTVVHREIRMTHVIDACNRANNHLWSVLGGLPRGTDVKLEEALARAKLRLVSPTSISHATAVVEEYISRLAKSLAKCLNARSAYISTQHESARVNYPAELPALMDCIARLIVLLDKLPPVEERGKVCVCCYCDPSGVGLLKLERLEGPRKTSSATLSCSNEKWRKTLRSVLQRLGGELEVGLIEELQAVVILADTAWDSPVCLLTPTVAVHGPCPQSHPLLDDIAKLRPISTLPVPHHRSSVASVVAGAVGAVGSAVAGASAVGSAVFGMGSVSTSHTTNTSNSSTLANLFLLSSFTPSFLQSAQSKCLNASSQWMAAYPLAARLVAEHTSSALVACLNSVCRQFKRNATWISERAAEEIARRYTESVRSSREEAVSGSLVQNSSSHSLTSEASLAHLVSFANESVLMSRFCAKTWANGVSAKFTPEIFLTCMDGLSSAFLTTAAETCQSIVKLHFFPRAKFDMFKAWNPKVLTRNPASPMDQCRILVEQFLAALDLLSTIPCIKDGIFALLAGAVARAYAPALIKHKPKMKTFKTLPELLSRDLTVYRDLFKKQLAPQLISQNLAVVEEIEKLVCEKNRINFSIYFNSFVRLLGSPGQAFTILSAVAKMREHEFASSADKKDVANMIGSMKQMVTKGVEFDASTAMDDGASCDGSETAVHKDKKTGQTCISLGVGTLKVNWPFED